MQVEVAYSKVAYCSLISATCSATCSDFTLLSNSTPDKNFGCTCSRNLWKKKGVLCLVQKSRFDSLNNRNVRIMRRGRIGHIRGVLIRFQHESLVVSLVLFFLTRIFVRTIRDFIVQLILLTKQKIIGSFFTNLG